MALTNKQRVFIEEYLTCWNATEAARRAGYAHPHVQGTQTLENLSVKEAVQARIAELAMTADEVLLRLADHARASMGDFLTNGDIDLRKAERDGKLHLLKSYTVTDKSQRVELHDAQAALVHLGKHHGLFTEKHEHRVTGAMFTADDLAMAKEELEKWKRETFGSDE